MYWLGLSPVAKGFRVQGPDVFGVILVAVLFLV